MDKTSYKSKYNVKDLKVLYLLNQNARLTAREIGKLTHTSREMADYRIKKLIKTNAINSFHTTISLARLGFSSYNMLLQLERSSLEDETRLLNFLTNYPLVRYVVRCRGNWDFNVSFVCKDRVQLSTFIDELRTFSTILGSEALLIPIKPVKFDDLWFLSHVSYEYHEPIITLPAKTDAIYHEMLLTLADNARISLRKLSRQIKLSPDATYQRFKKLQAMGIIRRFKANLNTERFGLQQYDLYLKIDNYSQEEEAHLRTFFKEQKNILRVTRIVGNYDLGLTLLCKDLAEFESKLEEVRHHFGKRIKNYIFALVAKEYKRTSCPSGVFQKKEAIE